MKKIVAAVALSLSIVVLTFGHTSTVYSVSVYTIEEYKKIDSSELPPAVIQALLKDYPTSRLGQAFKNRYGKYKLVMVLKNGTRRTVYIDAYGRWQTK